MSNIFENVAIIGMGCSQFGELYDKGASEIIVDAVYEAYEDAGIGPDEIQAGWVGVYYPDWVRGGHGGVALTDPLGLMMIPVTRVENFCASGMEAFRNACFGVACGMYDTVLALGWEKLKDSGARGLPELGRHPVVARGRSSPGLFALLATRYFYQYGHKNGKELLAKVAVKNHHNGTLSPKAYLRREITVEQAMNAAMVSEPLGLFDCCGVADGAAAAIITRKDLARKRGRDYINVRAIGMSTWTLWPLTKPEFDCVSIPPTSAAAKQAYQQAGIRDPRKEIDLAQCHDCFTITEILNYEDLGFAKRGEGWRLIDEGITTLKGELPVNTDGGLKSFGHPVGATGIRMVYENYNQLLGRAGPRQLKNPEIALAHTLGGTLASSCVIITTN